MTEEEKRKAMRTSKAIASMIYGIVNEIEGATQSEKNAMGGAMLAGAFIGVQLANGHPDSAVELENALALVLDIPITEWEGVE